MNFYKTLGLKNSRIDVADALRGLAVAGIILYHSVEHFNMYDGSIEHAYTLGCDDWMADVLALLLSGKMYGIFALLFGLSFFIMNDNQQQRGNCFSGRFAWRMFLLAMLGIVNTAFFDGDILFSYAIYGLVLIPLSYLPTKWLWWVVAFLFIQPVEIYSRISGWQVDASALSEVYGNMYHGHQHGTFLENAYSNLRYGQVATYYWCLMKGRHTQTICLFILGMLVGRKRLSYPRQWRWRQTRFPFIPASYNPCRALHADNNGITRTEIVETGIAILINAAYQKVKVVIGISFFY